MKYLDELIMELMKVLNLSITIPESIDEKQKLFRGLMNLCPPRNFDNDFFEKQDFYLQDCFKDKKVILFTNISDVYNQVYLWLGDITLLKCDVIVNAGNDAGLGCFVPGHRCVDNAIHSAAGLQLRNECNDILKGNVLSVGDFIECDGYNLPSSKVITTVGPCVIDEVTKESELLLAKCYRNILEYVISNGYESIAFPSISTGLYGFPLSKAKQIVFNTVSDVLKKHQSAIKVILVLYSKEDFNEYKCLFESKKANS